MKETIDALSCYRKIASVDEEHGVYLVQHTESKKIYVEKIRDVYNLSVYRYLMENRLKGMPEIIDLIDKDHVLITIEEYIPGDTIRTKLDNGYLFSEEETIQYIIKLCNIVKQLHEADPPIVHRDIKPSNIIITPDNEVKLLDMNAAKNIKESQTRDTMLLGTVGYAAPEQYGFGASGVPADIYSIGVLMNEMLTGKDISEKTEGKLRKVVSKCTMLDPKDRYQSIDALLKDMNPAQAAIQKRTLPKRIPFLPPGYRSGNPQNIAISTLGYVFLVALSLTIKIQNAKSLATERLEKAFILFTGLGIVCLTCNYLNVWKKLKLDRIRNPVLKAITVLVTDLLFMFLMFIVLMIAETMWM